MIRRFLDVSSGHLAPATWEWLDAELAEERLRDTSRRGSTLPGGPTRHGWFVYAPEDPSAEAMPDDLTAVLRHARQLGCEYVLFDCDALPMEDLPVLHPDFADPPAATDAG